MHVSYNLYALPQKKWLKSSSLVFFSVFKTQEVPVTSKMHAVPLGMDIVCIKDPACPLLYIISVMMAEFMCHKDRLPDYQITLRHSVRPVNC